MGPLLAVSRTEISQITLFALDEPERELATIGTEGEQPFGLAFDETGSYLYAACWTSAKVAIINLGCLRQAASLSAAKLPAWATLRPGANEIWISHEGAGVVSIVDTRTRSVSGQIATGKGPSDIAFTHSSCYAWITNEKDQNISMVDAEQRRKICDVRVGKIPQGIATVKGGDRLLVANFGSNSVSVVDTASRKEVAQIAVGRGPVDVVTQAGDQFERAWVTCFKEHAVSIIDVNRCEQIEQIVTGGKPQGLEMHPDGNRIYASVRDLDEIAVLSTDVPFTILRRIDTSGGPARMAVTVKNGVRTDIPSH